MNRNGLTRRYDQPTAPERLTLIIAAVRAAWLPRLPVRYPCRGLEALLRRLADCAGGVARLPARLTATLADALLQAIGVSVLDQRLEALQAVRLGRKEKE